MDASSPLKSLGHAASLAYKLILTVAVGALILSHVTTWLHFRQVDNGLADAEKLLERGRLAEADALAFRLEPWSRCFPGRYRSCGILRVRCLVRSSQTEAAAQLAEHLRLDEGDETVSAGWDDLIHEPLLWLQKISVSQVSAIGNGFFPISRPGEWTAYEVLLDELVKRRDTEGVETLEADISTRFPQSGISVYASSAKGELNPPEFPTSAYSATNASKAKPPAPPPTNPAPEQAQAAVSNEPAAAEEPAPAAGPALSWGIVTNALSMALNPESGKPLRQLKAGDVLVIEGSCTIQNVPALTGTLILNNRNVQNLAFKADDLEIRTGDFKAVHPAEVALRSRLAEIRILEDELAPKAARETANLTPQEIAYRTAQNRMDAFQRDVTALNTKLENATGSERMATLDKLRLMKYQEQTLLRELNTRKEALAVLGRSSSTNQAKFEPQLTALRQEKQAILKRLAATAP